VREAKREEERGGGKPSKYRQNTTHLSREGQEVRRLEGREFHGAPGTCDFFFFSDRIEYLGGLDS